MKGESDAVVFQARGESVFINKLTNDDKHDDNFDDSLYRKIGQTLSIIRGIYRVSNNVVENYPDNEVNYLEVEQNCCIGTCTNFADLPESILLYIFSYLDVLSMCRLSKVCKTWYHCLNDPLMWNNKLSRDSMKWETIDHLSHPRLHQLTNPEFSPKEIYLRCCPELQCFASNKQLINFPMKISNLKFYFGFSTPRVVMFGSGLDSSGFVRELFWNTTSPFEVKGMFPGKFDGIGSGVTLQYSGGFLNMITLYSLSKAERDNQNVNEDRQSKLLAHQSNEVVLSQRVRELLSTVDALIYIVNSSNEERVAFGKEEFYAMTDSRWLPEKTPVLILCTTKSDEVNVVPSLKVSDHLSLLHLTRPWRVQQCELSSLNGLLPGVKWLHKNIMYV